MLPMKFLERLKKPARWKALWIVLAAAAFITGAAMVFYSQNGKVYISLKSGAGPAAEGRKLAEASDSTEMLALRRSELKNYGPQRLFSKSQTEKSGSDVKFYLGNFIIPSGAASDRAFICDVYNFVEMTFSGLDSNLSGKSGSMAFKTPCRTKDPDFIGPFLFPLDRVASRPEQMDFVSGSVRVRFYNMASYMNENWLLISARFFNSQKEDGFLVTFHPAPASPAFELHLSFAAGASETPQPAGKL